MDAYKYVLETTFDWTNAAELSKLLGSEVKSAELQSLSGAGGMSGARMDRLVVTGADDAKRSYVLKRTVPVNANMNRDLGMTREALFYAELAPVLAKHLDALAAGSQASLPTVVLSAADPERGVKAILMDDLGKVRVSHCMRMM